MKQKRLDKEKFKLIYYSLFTQSTLYNNLIFSFDRNSLENERLISKVKTSLDEIYHIYTNLKGEYSNAYGNKAIIKWQNEVVKDYTKNEY